MIENYKELLTKETCPKCKGPLLMCQPEAAYCPNQGCNISDNLFIFPFGGTENPFKNMKEYMKAKQTVVKRLHPTVNLK